MLNLRLDNVISESNQPNSVRPTVQYLVVPTCKAVIELTANRCISFTANTKAAAVSRHDESGGAAIGHATFFVVSFVLVLNRIHFFAVNSIPVLHVGTTGQRTVGRTALG